MDSRQLLSITRPDPRLMHLYLIRAILSGPLVVLTLPVLFFRYHTMRYRFDEEGIGMSWGLLFRREVNLTFARIQDIHVTSGPLQRWLGLADLKIQTASGNMSAEMTIEGLLNYEQVRDFLYTRMRGYREPAGAGVPDLVPPPLPAASDTEAECLRLLGEIAAELRATRAALAPAANAAPQEEVPAHD